MNVLVIISLAIPCLASSMPSVQQVLSVSEDLLSVLQQHLFDLLKQYPDSSLIQSLLYQPTLPYKGNLLTRLYELDELIAPVENQLSIFS